MVGSLSAHFLQPEQIINTLKAKTLIYKNSRLSSNIQKSSDAGVHKGQHSPLSETRQFGLEMNLTCLGTVKLGHSLLQILSEGFHTRAALSCQTVLQRAEETTQSSNEFYKSSLHTAQEHKNLTAHPAYSISLERPLVCSCCTAPQHYRTYLQVGIHPPNDLIFSLQQLVESGSFITKALTLETCSSNKCILGVQCGVEFLPFLCEDLGNSREHTAAKSVF